MKPTAKRRLVLETETVRTLSAVQLDGVVGAGFTDFSGSCSCNSCICSYFGNCGPVPSPKGPGGENAGGR